MKEIVTPAKAGVSASALADSILIIHVLFVAVVVLGAPLIAIGGWRKWRWVRNPWIRLTHFAMIGFVAAESITGIECPLTTWENNLRLQSGGQHYGENGFIATWLDSLLFYPFPHWVFTTAYVSYGMLVLSLLYFVPICWRKPKQA